MKRLYVIGDSISIRYGPYLAQYLKGTMIYARKTAEEAAALALDPPQGANGGDSSMALAFLEARIASGGIDADLLLLNCGLWDIRSDPLTGRKQIPLAQYSENLHALVALVQGAGPQLVWVRTTPVDERVHNTREGGFYRFAADCDAYNQTADEVMRAHRVPIIDLYTFTRNLGEDLYADHVHFHEHVREKQGAFIADGSRRA
ncbi:MAG: SGNH/GDSL hydrolase family protein [Anaerolineae bacterium]|nr:SGNH/GDSL hydrolase family protein [Anaerolineae bacterium]